MTATSKMTANVKMTATLRTLATTVLVLMLAVPAFAADYTIIQQTTANGNTYNSETYLTDGMIRNTGADSDTIMNTETGEMTFIDHRKKEYWTTTFEELTAQFSALEESGPAASILEGIMGGGGEVEVQKMDDTRTVAGYETQLYKVTMGDNIRFDLWIAPELKVDGSYFDSRKLPYAAMGPMGKQFQDLFDAMKEIGAISLASDTSFKVMGRTMETTTETTEVKVGPIAASVFDPPANYKQTDSPY